MKNEKALMEELNGLWNDGHEEALMYLMDRISKSSIRATLLGFVVGVPIALVLNWGVVRQLNKSKQNEEES